MQHTQNGLQKKQKTKFLRSTRVNDLKMQKQISPNTKQIAELKHECKCCQPKNKKIAQEAVPKD